MKIFDAHFHLIDPQFPIIENQGFLPDGMLSSILMLQSYPN